jgi:HlyD family secretion protein
MPAFLRNRWTWVGLMAMLVLVVGFVFLQGQAKMARAKTSPTATAAAAKAAQAASPYAAIAAGKADVEGGVIQVAARTAGVILAVNVNEGATVSKGQVLAQLEDSPQKLAVANAEAAVAQAAAQIHLLEVQKATAQREYERLSKLQARNFVAGQAVDNAADAIKTADAQIATQRAAVATAGAALNSSRYQLELTRVRAPADGKIVRRYANPGAGASTLNVSTLFDLVPNTQHIVRAEIAESDIPNVFVGQTVELTPEAGAGKPFVGKVLRRSDEFGGRKLISDDPTEQTDARVVEVVVAADNTPFLIGQRVLVKFMKPGQVAGAPQPVALSKADGRAK